MVRICVFINLLIFNQYIFFSKNSLFLCINPYLIENFSCPKHFVITATLFDKELIIYDAIWKRELPSPHVV